MHPCFRIRGELGSGGSHGEEEVNCRVGRNDRQGNDGMGYEVDREMNRRRRKVRSEASNRVGRNDRLGGGFERKESSEKERGQEVGGSQ